MVVAGPEGEMEVRAGSTLVIPHGGLSPEIVAPLWARYGIALA